VATSFSLLEALQHFLEERKVVVEMLTVDPAVTAMLDWYRLRKADVLGGAPAADVLVCQYGGWSEGCATGYKFSVLRRVTDAGGQATPTDWFAGVTLMFEPSGAVGLTPLRIASSQYPTLDAFLEAIEASDGFQSLRRQRPMGVLLESGGLR
jgi:hypothetical protein